MSRQRRAGIRSGHCDPATTHGFGLFGACVDMSMDSVQLLCEAPFSKATGITSRAWSRKTDTELVRLAYLHETDAGFDWIAVAAQMGRTPKACETRFDAIQRAPDSQLLEGSDICGLSNVEQQVISDSGDKWMAFADDMDDTPELYDAHSNATSCPSSPQTSEDPGTRMSSEAPQQPEPVPVANQAVPTEPVDSLLELRGVQLEMLRRAPNLIVYDDLHVRVSREVQRQVESGSDVNWAAVAEAVGATVLECLENNTYDQGKRSWEYNFREFTWDLPNRLRDFVSEHYPKPIQPNFTAVSNYMWIVKDDCITMRRLTTGRFKWTQEMLAKATRLKEKGRDNAFIAKRLSPQLSAIAVYKALNHKKQPASATLSSKVKKEVRSAIDSIVGKVPCSQIAKTVRKSFPDIPTTPFQTLVFSYLASHEFYKKKVMALNYYNIIDGIIERGEAAINIAKELDLPYHIVHQLVLKRQAKEHSGTWTKIEIKKLLDFVNSAKGRRDWKHCASIIGTKSSSQCYSKWLHMRD